MDFVAFKTWLIDYKGMTTRAASDVPSRLRRITKLLDCVDVDNTTYANLKRNSTYQEYSVTVRSQMKRALTLYLEFEATKSM